MIEQLEIRGFDRNFSYFVIDESSKKLAIVDPGDPDHLLAAIAADNLVPEAIMLTHGHFDHTEGVERILVEYPSLPVYIHAKAEGNLNFQADNIVYLNDAEVIKIGGLQVKVIYTPGHCDDAVCYLIQTGEDLNLITGDTLFVEGCGRTDLPTGDTAQLYESLNKLKKFDPSIIIWPGHDYGSTKKSTLGQEMKANRFLNCDSLEEFSKKRD